MAEQKWTMWDVPFVAMSKRIRQQKQAKSKVDGISLNEMHQELSPMRGSNPQP